MERIPTKSWKQPLKVISVLRSRAKWNNLGWEKCLILNIRVEHLLVKRILFSSSLLTLRGDVNGMHESINLWSASSHLQNELNNRCWSTVSVSFTNEKSVQKPKKHPLPPLDNKKCSLPGTLVTMSQMSKSIKWCSRTAVIVDKAGQESTCIFWSVICCSASEKKG